MKTILVVDDDIHIMEMLCEALKKEGYKALKAYSGTEALLLLKEQRPDLVILDLMLPGMRGEEVQKRISGIPVIILSARAGVEEKVSLLMEGAADYVTKPFHIRELLARIAVQLRRRPETAKTLSFEDLRMDLDAHAVYAGETFVKLTKTEYAILKQLLKSPSAVIPKSRLLELISLDTPDCMESSLKVHISNLRRKLKAADGKDYIEAVWGIGFKLREE